MLESEGEMEEVLRVLNIREPPAEGWKGQPTVAGGSGPSAQVSFKQFWSKRRSRFRIRGHW